MRGLRVQVLLWTIVPLIIVLLLMSLTGVGSHQGAVRQLVTEENNNLMDVAGEAVRTRLALYSTLLATYSSAATPVHSLPVSDKTLPALEVWRIDRRGLSAGGLPVPAWVQRAAAEAARRPQDSGTWMTFDAPAQRIVWVLPRAEPSGWEVGGIPSRGLGLAALIAPTGERSAPALAVVDAQGRIVDSNDVAGKIGATLEWLELEPALLGRREVQFVSTGEQQTVVTYAPIQAASVPGAPWTMIIRRPIGDLIAPFFRLEQVLPLMLVAAAILSFLTLYFGLRLIVRPLRLLVECSGRIGQGEFQAAAHCVGGLQEIEELRQALDAMAQRLQSEQAALQDYLRAVTNTQEEERARLARELHDETVQTLIALDHKAQLVLRGLDKHPERTRAQVADLRKITAAATQEVRRLSYGLRPLCLEEIGLDAALERLAQEAEACYCCRGAARRLAGEKELALYRIAQESLSNARRHAHAQSIRLILIFGPATVTLGVGDDGIGFQMPSKLSELTQGGHFGLMGMQERTQLIGGRLFCESLPGRGTAIMVQTACTGDKCSGTDCSGTACSRSPVDDEAIAALRGELAG